MMFADKVQAFLITGKGHYLDGSARKSSKASMSILTQYNIKLRAAKRYSIDNEGVYTIAQQSHEYERLDNFAAIARLPFDVCWFEHSLYEKLEYLEDHGLLQDKFNRNEVSPIVGLLMHRDAPDSSRWVCQPFYEIEGAAYPSILMFVFDPEASPVNPVTGSTTWKSLTASLLSDMPKIPVSLHLDKENKELAIPQTCDSEYVIAGNLMLKDGEIVGDDWTRGRIGVCLNPYWLIEVGKKKLHEVFTKEVKEESGHIRFIVTMLALINSLPNDREDVESSGKRVVGMHMQPFFSHTKLTIRIPKENTKRYINKHVNAQLRNMKKRWHEVRGYWRVIEYGKSTHNCNHKPTMRDSRLAICESCGLLIKWMPESARGDATIGIVNHDYQIKGKKNV